jgi:hypothetical protein
MQIFTLIRPMMAVAALVLVSLALSAQEIKKEVHIKIVENGVVTKDTVYNFTGDLPDIERFAEMEAKHAGMEGRHMKERHVIVMNDSTSEDLDWVQENGKHKEMRKEVTVRVNSGNEGGEMADVEEIWIGGAEDGKPCHTIIIHEGNCPGEHMEVDQMMPPPPPPHEGQMMPTPPPPPPHHAGQEHVTTEKKVIKTESGDKVIILETKDDNQTRTKVKSKK